MQDKLAGGGKGKGGKGGKGDEPEKKPDDVAGGKGGKGDDDVADEDKDKKAEALRVQNGNLQEQLARQTLESKAFRLLAEKGIRVSPLVELAIAGCKDDAQVKKLVESLQAGQPTGARSGFTPAPAPGDKPLPDSPKTLREQYA